ncbi:hypothetical protein ACHAXT_010700 [Thalassiosira profunda]
MNQPRYRDNAGGDSWHNNNASNRRTVHSTGRSNYGGGRRNKKQGNPIGNWIQNRRQRRTRRQDSGAVGTEANALKNIERNAKHFAYPPEGFVTPIEHSLLYAMIEFPERYPEGVVKGEIEDEEFEVYLYIKDEKRKGSAKHDDRGRENEGEGNGEDGEGSDHAQTAAANNEEEEPRVSYAQLSALASLSAEKNPAVASEDQDKPAAASQSAAPNRSNGQEEQLTIGQTLVRKLLRVITRYSDAHSLDRQTEIREFLAPIEKRCQMRNEKAALQQLLPAYAGYTLSLMTGNPLPLLIGAAALTGPDPMMEENSNVSGFRAVGGRAGDVETAGLLDECESD